jgi:hypothetical protein
VAYATGIRAAKVCLFVCFFNSRPFSSLGCVIPMDDTKFTLHDRSTIAVTWKDFETTKLYNTALANVHSHSVPFLFLLML